ncbi:hypothetical protein BJV78DRAFT_615771 [Lactifluus subvellereus]|nr:hypothetical protein BJV78DRAFT_615771 [Lactifluus subvellereus]
MILSYVMANTFSRMEISRSWLAELGIREHEALPIIISLGDIERKDFEAFLSVIYPDDFEEHGLSYEQWKSVLRLSTRWGFASLRKLALRSIEPPTPFDQLLLARAYSVDHWVLPALSALCERPVPLSLNEARQMSIEDVVLVTTVREDIRRQELQVDSSEIEHCIEAAQAGMLAAVSAGNGASPRDSPRDETFTSRSTERSPGSKAEAESEEDAKAGPPEASPVDVRRANWTRRQKDPPADGGGSPVASPVAVQPADKSGRASSAWGKILVVPSPTLTVRSPHSPVWGSSTDPMESHDPFAWSTRRVKSARRSSPGHIQVRTAQHDSSDGSWS